MANEPNGNSGDDVVHGKDLLTRGLDAFFGKLGDMIHGATQKDETKDGASSEEVPTDKPIEAEGEEVPARKSEAPPQVA